MINLAQQIDNALRTTGCVIAAHATEAQESFEAGKAWTFLDSYAASWHLERALNDEIHPMYSLFANRRDKRSLRAAVRVDGRYLTVGGHELPTLND